MMNYYYERYLKLHFFTLLYCKSYQCELQKIVLHSIIYFRVKIFNDFHCLKQ